MTRPVDLYELLPAIHAREDASLGYPLEALLDIISTEVEHVQRNITDLWDDFFIETAAEWVVPYIGDLVGATPLHNVAGSRRADVANTIAYRRRKGTLGMLEELAADVTGWGARVVDFFELLEWSQHLDHVRRQPGSHPARSKRVGTADVSDADALDLLDGPFDKIAHTVDVRPFGEGRGRHNLRKVGFFLWRLQSYPLFGVDPRQSPDHPHGYHLSPLGNDAPLSTNIAAPRTGRRGESDLPGPIRPLALRTDVGEAADEDALASRYYGPDAHHSVGVAVGDPGGEFRADLIPASRACVCDLADWRRPPEGKDVAIDPVRGRVTLSAEREPAPGEVVRASMCYAFSGGAGGDLGGGPYDRLDSLRSPPAGARTTEVSKRGSAAFDEIGAAIADWRAQAPAPGSTAVIEVLDNATYAEGDLLAEVPEGCRLEIRARNGQRPVLDVGELRAQGEGAGDARLVVNGLVVVGGPMRVGAGLAALELRHCTLVPGQSFTPEGQAAAPDEPSLVADGAQDCHVTISHSILGAVELGAEGLALTVATSIVDAGTAETAIGGPDGETGPRCDLRRVTVLGDVRVRTLSYASEVLFDGMVTSERTQVGCVRFSWVTPGSTTPPRYRCQPDIAIEGADPSAKARSQSRLRPRFTSRQYGSPGYAQLSVDAAAELRTGAADGSQIGAFNRLREPQREANLRLRLDEYLPAGLEAGLIYVT